MVINSNLINVSIEFSQKIDMVLDLPEHLIGKSKNEIEHFFKDKKLSYLKKLSHKSEKHGFQISSMDIKPFNEDDNGNNLTDDLLKNGFEVLHVWDKGSCTLCSKDKIYKGRYIIIDQESPLYIHVYSATIQSVCIASNGKDKGVTFWDNNCVYSSSENRVPTSVSSLTYIEFVEICKKQGYNIS